MRPATVAATAFITAALSLGACVEPDPVEVSTAFVQSCEPWGCGTNGPNMGRFRFHEVNRVGVEHAGLRLDGLWKNGERYRVDVFGDQLSGYRADRPRLSRDALTGAYLRLVDGTNGEWRIFIEHVSHDVTPWHFASDGTIETYWLRYESPGLPPGVRRELCNHPPPQGTGAGGETWLHADEAIIFTGDRYDAATKRVTATTAAATADWFNIACAGSVLAKMHLNRYTTASVRPTHSTTPAERNDLLAMYTANVCGTGQSYTVNGTDIRWTGTNGWNAYDQPSPAVALEGVWGDGRAQCIDTFRIPANQGAFACEVPACESLEGNWFDHGTVMSGVP